MKVYESIPVPATTITKLIKRKCDLCGKISKSSNWEAGIYEVMKLKLK